MGKDASETIKHHAPYYIYNNSSCLFPRPSSICVTGASEFPVVSPNQLNLPKNPQMTPQSQSRLALSIIAAQGVNVSCAENDMSITLPKALFPGLDQNRLRLLNPSCQANATATHYILETPLIGCGTTRRHTDAAVVYSNAVLEMPDEFSIIRRTREFEIPFSCYYDNKGSVSSVGLKPTSTKLVFSQSGKGNFSLLLDMFPNETFTAPFSDGDFPISVLLGQRLYFQVAVTSEDQGLSIIADKCYAIPTQDIDAEPKYELITDG